MQGLTDIEEHQLDTPFGKPSSPIMLGMLNGRQVAFLARHGLGHTLSPGEVNYRANIYAMKMIGVRRLLSISACGSLRDDFPPGDIVIPESRAKTFFSGGIVVHLSIPDPFCPELSALLEASSRAVGGKVHRGGSYITIDGPRFSTRAESNTFRAWGMSIIGMTTSPEAFLAREAEMCYTVMAHVTDFDVWHLTEEAVTAEMVFKTVVANTLLAQQAIADFVQQLPAGPSCHCQEALKGAISTRAEAISPELREKYDLLLGHYLS
jgi:5'-methylthioadenosine phosphorylase